MHRKALVYFKWGKQELVKKKQKKKRTGKRKQNQKRKQRKKNSMGARKRYIAQLSKEILSAVDYNTNVTDADEQLKQDVDKLAVMLYRHLKEKHTHKADLEHKHRVGVAKVTKHGNVALRSQYLRLLASLVSAFVREQSDARQAPLSSEECHFVREYIHELLHASELETNPADRRALFAEVLSAGAQIGANRGATLDPEQDSSNANAALEQLQPQLDALDERLDAYANAMDPKNNGMLRAELKSLADAVNGLRLAVNPLKVEGRTWQEVREYVSRFSRHVAEMQRHFTNQERDGFMFHLHLIVNDPVPSVPNPLKLRPSVIRFTKKVKSVLHAYRKAGRSSQSAKNELGEALLYANHLSKTFKKLASVDNFERYEKEEGTKDAVYDAHTSVLAIAEHMTSTADKVPDNAKHAAALLHVSDPMTSVVYAHDREDTLEGLKRLLAALGDPKVLEAFSLFRKPNLGASARMMAVGLRGILSDEAIKHSKAETGSTDVYLYARAGKPTARSHWPESAKTHSPWRGEFIRLKKSELQDRFNSVDKRYATHDRQRGVLIFVNKKESLAYLVPVEGLQKNFPDVYQTIDDGLKTYLYHRANGVSHAEAIRKSESQHVSEDEFQKLVSTPARAYVTVKDNPKLPELLAAAVKLHVDENKGTEESLRGVPGNVDVVVTNHVENKRHHALLKNVLKSLKGYFQNSNQDWSRVRIGPYAGNDGMGYQDHPGTVLLRLNVSEGTSVAYLAVSPILYNDRLVDVFKTDGERLEEKELTYLYLRAARVAHDTALKAATSERKPVVIRNNPEYLAWLTKRFQDAGEDKKKADVYAMLIKNLKKADPRLNGNPPTTKPVPQVKQEEPQKAQPGAAQGKKKKQDQTVEEKFGIDPKYAKLEDSAFKDLRTRPPISKPRAKQTKPGQKVAKEKKDETEQPSQQPEKKKGFFSRLKQVFTGAEIGECLQQPVERAFEDDGAKIVTVTAEDVDRLMLRMAMASAYAAIGAMQIVHENGE